MQDDGIADSDLLLFGYVFQLSSPFHVHSVNNEPNLLRQNATTVFAIEHPQALLLVFLQVQCGASEHNLFLSCMDVRSSSVIFESRLLSRSVWRLRRLKFVFLRGAILSPNKM
ncbi:hypothetical protein TNCV_4630011 [Trichonephila clavipes]|nr:hypothetical protein TNCV_4630011 [Trichonephila clavipes]